MEKYLGSLGDCEKRQQALNNRNERIRVAESTFLYGAQKVIRSCNLNNKEKVNWMLEKLRIAEREIDRAEKDYYKDLYEISIGDVNQIYLDNAL